jgi:hypothetical protein
MSERAFHNSNASFADIHKQHDGNWAAVLTQLGIDAKLLDGKHRQCPRVGCASKDGFRFDDKDGRGTWICSQGIGEPVAGDGPALLVHAQVARDSSDALKLLARPLTPATPQTRSVSRKTPYKYLNADGELALTVTRVDHSNGDKTFSQKTARGLTPTKDDQFEHLPYNLPALVNKPDATIHIVEGEKCADALNALGLVATCNAGGAGNWQPELAQYFAGRDVVILPDNDEAGEAHCRKVADALLDNARAVSVCRLPGLEHKGDVVDWLAMGNTGKDLWGELQRAEPIDDGLGMTLAQLSRIEITKPDPVHEHLPHGFTLLAGAPKAGKSTFMEWLAFELGAAVPILYLALEYQLPMLKARFDWMADRPNIRLFHEGQFPKMDAGGSDKLNRLLEKLSPQLTVIDTLAKVKRPGSERGYEGENESMAELKELFGAHDLSCVCIHHTRKASVHDNADDPFERILGSTALAAVPDNLMVLLSEGGQTVLHTKGRLVASSVKHFRLNGHQFEFDGSAGAELRGKADRQADILEMLAEGPATQVELSAELGIDTGNLSRMCKLLEAKKKIRRERRGAPWELSGEDLF